MNSAKFLFIEYHIAKSGTITPIIHFKPVTIKKVKHDKAPTTFSHLRQIPVSPGQNIVLVDNGAGSPEIVSVTGTPIVTIPIPDRCPCCKNPINNTLQTVQCTNPNCPEKKPLNDCHCERSEATSNFKTYSLDPSFGTLAAIRYAAIPTTAIIARKNRMSKTPIICYTANAQLDHILYNAGLCHCER